MKEKVKILLNKYKIKSLDLGTFSEERVDYPDYAKKHGIDPTVPRNAMNDIIKSAWYELGSEYIPFEPLPLKPYMLPEPELDRDIIRPEIEKDSRKIK